MNTWIGMGRLTRDVELRAGENTVARFSIAVNRRFKNAEGNYDADFINCVAFGKSAEFVEKYFHKGDMIAIKGRLQIGNYTNKDGVRIPTTDIVVEETDFCGGKGDSQAPSKTSGNDGFMNIPDGIDEELPFN